MSLSKNDIKFIRSLHQKKFRDQEGLFLVEGVKLLNELLEQDKFEIQHIYCVEDAALNQLNGAELTIVSAKELERISSFKSPNQVVAIVKQATPVAIDYVSNQTCLMLDSINDPGNLGTIIRTADWFGIKQVICSNDSVDLYNPKVVQSTMGAIFRVDVIYAELTSALVEFQKKDFDLLSAEMDGENAFEKKYGSKSLLLMGSESHGVSEQLSGLCTKISIPSFGETESLNVGMATGIILSHIAKQVK